MNGDEGWIPCIFELETVQGKVESSTWTIRNTEPVELMALTYAIPLASQRGNQSLYLSAIRVGVHDADPANHVSKIQARGNTYHDSKEFFEIDNVWSSPQRIEVDVPDKNCGGFDNVKVVVYMKCAAKSGVDISFVTAKYYYR